MRRMEWAEDIIRMEDERTPPLKKKNVRNEKFLNKSSVGKTKYKMAGCRPERCIANPRSTRMETSREYRRMEEPFEGGQSPGEL